MYILKKLSSNKTTTSTTTTTSSTPATTTTSSTPTTATKSNISSLKNKDNNKDNDNDSSSQSPYEFKKANYYNYYRKLEQSNENDFRNRTCLIGQGDTSISSSFKLVDFEIQSELLDTSVVSVWSQQYSNSTNKPIEAKYQLPLSPLSVISKFIVEYQDKVLEAVIKEKSEALEEYNDTIASGGQAFLGEKSDDGLFNFMIGNLPPNENVTIKLTIVSELGTHLNSLHYCLHRFMFPMYNFNFKYNLLISLSEPIKNIQLDYYNSTINYSNDKKNATVSFTTSIGIKDNIIAIIEPESSDKPQSLIEYNPIDKSYAIALNFYPVFDQINYQDVYQKSEIIFVIDCSGSMRGEPIQKAKRALEICIRSLHENNKFNIYCFGSSFKKVFDKSLLYNDETLLKASNYIDKMDANLGGTQLLGPIKDILSNESQDANEYPRQVFILTDGAVSGRNQLIDYVGKEANSTRLFTFGIGSGVDQELVIGLSNACKGYYEFIKDNKYMEEKVMKLLSIANEPTLSNIKIDWGNSDLSIVQSPALIRPIFNRERMMVYGLLNKEPNNINQLVQVKMIGDGPLGDKLTFTVDLDFSKANSNSTQIHTLAAFKQIQDLEESERKNSKDHKEQIVKLGKAFGLVSKHTSYIVSAESTDGQVIEESMESVDILSSKNIVMDQDKGSVRLSSKDCKKKSKECESRERSSSPTSSLARRSSSLSQDKSKKKSMSKSWSSDEIEVKDNGLLALIKLQKANGSFTLNSITKFKIDLSKVPSELSNHTDIWVTLLVIAKLNKEFKNEKSQWDRIALKAIRWIKSQLASLNILDSFDKFNNLSLDSI